MSRRLLEPPQPRRADERCRKPTADRCRDADIDASVLDELDRELIALAPVKTRIREIAALLLIDRLRREVGPAAAPAVAAHVLHRQPRHGQDDGRDADGPDPAPARLHRAKRASSPVTRDDLVGQYVGHTAPKTKEVLKRAYGGVLFIDEAYYLYRPENERDYGQEAIEILLQVMEAERDKLVVIFAGYKDRMDDFFRLQPGMTSRVAHHIDFPDYDRRRADGDRAPDARAAELRCSRPGPRWRSASYLERRMQPPRFAHGRSVRNAIDRARLRQANRLFAQTRAALPRGADDDHPDDILESSVFAEDHEPRTSRRARDDWRRRT